MILIDYKFIKFLLTMYLRDKLVTNLCNKILQY